MKRLSWLVLAFIFVVSLFCCLPVVPQSLEGKVSNVEGRIGIRTDWNRVVTRVYNDSPARLAGIFVGDKIVEIDGLPGKSASIIGPAYQNVKIMVARGALIYQFIIERKPSKEISKHYIGDSLSI